MEFQAGIKHDPKLLVVVDLHETFKSPKEGAMIGGSDMDLTDPVTGFDIAAARSVRSAQRYGIEFAIATAQGLTPDLQSYLEDTNSHYTRPVNIDGLITCDGAMVLTKQNSDISFLSGATYTAIIEATPENISVENGLGLKDVTIAMPAGREERSLLVLDGFRTEQDATAFVTGLKSRGCTDANFKTHYSLRSDRYKVFCTPPGVDKGTGIRTLADRLTTPLTNVVFVGDGARDFAALELIKSGAHVLPIKGSNLEKKMRLGGFDVAAVVPPPSDAGISKLLYFLCRSRIGYSYGFLPGSYTGLATASDKILRNLI